MTEWMLNDAHEAHGLQYIVLRYFNVAGGDPQGRIGQSTPRATHLIKVACQTALASAITSRFSAWIYDTPDGTCLRDYIHVSDLIAAHVDGLSHLRKGGSSGIFNCGYGKGYSVLDVIKAVSASMAPPCRSNTQCCGRAIRWPSSPAPTGSLFSARRQPKHEKSPFHRRDGAVLGTEAGAAQRSLRLPAWPD